MIEETGSSAGSSPVKEVREAPAEQGSTLFLLPNLAPKRKHIARKTTAFTPIPKQKASTKQVPTKGPGEKEPVEPKPKRAKTSTLPTSNLAKFLQRSVVRGKIVKVAYFKEQGLEVFLDKLRVQDWLELFTNTQLRCYVPDLA